MHATFSSLAAGATNIITVVDITKGNFYIKTMIAREAPCSGYTGGIK